MAGPVCADEQGLAVVGELKARPVAGDGGWGVGRFVGAHVKGCKGGFVVVA